MRARTILTMAVAALTVVLSTACTGTSVFDELDPVSPQPVLTTGIEVEPGSIRDLGEYDGVRYFAAQRMAHATEENCVAMVSAADATREVVACNASDKVTLGSGEFGEAILYVKGNAEEHEGPGRRVSDYLVIDVP